MKTDDSAGRLAQPAEWFPHRATWTAWPAHRDLWQHNLEPVREAVRDLIRAINDPDPHTGRARGERVDLLVHDEDALANAKQMLAGLDVRFHTVPYGDIWLRDTAPVFVHDADGAVRPVSFRFNGWGGKYELPHDAEVSARVAALSGFAVVDERVVMEGGSIEVDGEGTCLTTRQCLLNPNRNPGLTQQDLERVLHHAIGTPTTLWVTDGLLNDHTDGHIDTIARFVATGVVVCMHPSGEDDPNRDVLLAIERELRAMRDHSGRALEVITVPSPGRVEDEDGRVMPASHVNFYIANTTVVVPTYGTAWDDEAVRAVGALFPGRRAVGVRAKELLAGGGAFHCITQQQPIRTMR